MEPSLSVIIPCYNGWKYFSKCLKSLSEQTAAIDEIIIIDDCSADETFDELNEYSKASGLNIIILRNPQNEGPGKSRQIGLLHATSDYVGFCDCDDWFENNWAEAAKKALKNSDVDLLIFDTFTALDDKRRKVDHITSDLVDKDQRYILAHYPMSLCRLIVKRSLFSEVKHTNLRHGEDGVVAAQLIALASKIKVVDIPLYNYFFRENSASKKPSKDACTELLESYQVIRVNIDDQFSSEIEYIGINYVCYGAILCGLKAGICHSALSRILDAFEKTNPKWENNPYKSSMGRLKRFYLSFVKNRCYLPLELLTRVHPVISKLKRIPKKGAER